MHLTTIISLMFVFQEPLCWSYLGISHLKQLALVCVGSGDVDNRVGYFKEKLTWCKGGPARAVGELSGDS